MLLSHFDPPGFVNDLNTEHQSHWSTFISDSIDAGVHQYVGNHFYNGTVKETFTDKQEKTISWTAFPKLITISSAGDLQRWQRADETREVQDEYCEWSVTRDASGKICRVTFTCEAPEYWHYLAAVNPGQVVKLYQQFVSPAVQAGDLFPSAGKYNQLNRWNNSTSGGAMHLVQENNTLSAQVDIAVRGTIVRFINDDYLAQPQELIDCGRYGNSDRHSDPHIGAEVNALARSNADITLKNPIGLYLEGLFPVGWATPDGSDPQMYWTVVRGTSDYAVRAEYLVPPDRGFTVGDITINGRPIQFGSQIADYIRVKLTGVACRFGQVVIPPQTTCEGRTPFKATAPSVTVIGAVPTGMFKNER